MRRREFFALFSALVPGWAIKARSETAGLPIVGYLSPTSAEGGAPYIAAVRSGLAEAGYREGQNVRIESRWADDRPDRLAGLAADLVGSGVKVIVTSAIRAALAAKDATSTIPIVFATANDPVQFKLVAGLNRPNGNLTGVTYLSSALGEKRLGLLHEVVPDAKTVAVLVNPGNANAERNLGNAQDAIRALGLQMEILRVSAISELDKALSEFARAGSGALMVLNDPLFFDQRKLLVELASRYQLSAIYYQREFVEAGGLMSYGAKVVDAYHQAGLYAGRILGGARPEDLPVVQPSKFEFVINLKTAKTLGLSIPSSIQLLADEVIE
jgi:putative tryptophan/tyrosine transport system substrate-binding protein